MRLTKKKNPSERALQEQFEAGMPDAAFLQARNEFYLSTGTAVVERSRYFVIILMLLAVVILGAVAAIRFVPLKTVEPWVIKVDPDKGFVGKAEGTAVRAPEYTPDRPVLERELFTFVSRLYAMNGDYPKLVKDGHISAYSYTRGRAVSEFKAFIDTEQPYQRQLAMPGLIRTAERKTITFREDGKLVLIRFRTSEINKVQTVPVFRDYLMTLQFMREQSNKPEEMERNPLGIYITHFEIVEER